MCSGLRAATHIRDATQRVVTNWINKRISYMLNFDAVFPIREERNEDVAGEDLIFH
jgi:hypothetical protein